jgi:Tfp pilus assembly protein PilO
MKTDNRQKILIFLTLGLLALMVGDKLVYSPLVRLWQSREKEIKTLRTQVAEGTALSKREQVIRKQWDTMRTNTLPNNPSLAQERVLKAFQEWAQESGVSINAITPQWKSDSEDYKTLVCRVDASGTLWMLSRFVYDIENASSPDNKSSLGPLGLKLESVDFSSKDNTGRQLSLGLQISGLVLTPK